MLSCDKVAVTHFHKALQDGKELTEIHGLLASLIEIHLILMGFPTKRKVCFKRKLKLSLKYMLMFLLEKAQWLLIF